MKTQEIKIGTYSEWKLEDKSTAELILNNYRDINVDFEWYSYIIDNFCLDAQKIGFDIDIDTIQFSGFNCQGAGASFIGTVDILEYLKKTKQLTKYSALRRSIDKGYIDNTAEIDRSTSNYCHENTCYFYDVEVFEDITSLVDIQLINLQNELKDKRIELCKELYKELSDNYDYLTSDEVIIKTLEINEYKFNEDGKIV